MLIGLLLVAAEASSAPAPAPPAAIWQITGAAGAVTSLTAHVKTGGRIVADEFVDDPDRVKDERLSLFQTHAPKGSCRWAADVRPFTRLRRFAADGRLLWEWHVHRELQALQLLAIPGGDCLSPDGGRLTVQIYRFSSGDPVFHMGGAVVAVDHRPRFVDAKGTKTHEEFNDSRYFDLSGWKPGRPATLMFDVVRDEGKTIVHDEAVLNDPHQRQPDH